MRAWITVAGAMEAIGSRFDLIDYVPAHHAVTGLCFGTWRTAKATRPGADGVREVISR
jgi:protocatechuate 4,5-dioxygenase beta chain